MSVQDLGVPSLKEYDLTARRAEVTAEPLQNRIIALDGLRGLMTIFVVFSHFFSEVPHGWPIFGFGWIAVTMFFVLSGYLVGNLILQKMAYSQFLTTFYIRRLCRTLPIYVVCVLLAEAIISQYSNYDWIDADHRFPLWSYLSFTQIFFMIGTDSVGAHWLSPTWTLALEEHFYMLVPAMFLIIPRRWLIGVLLAIGAAAVLLRLALFTLSPQWAMAGYVLLPLRADVLAAGLLLAVLLRTTNIEWPRFDLAIRVSPIILLFAAASISALDAKTGHVFDIVGPTLVSCASAIFILMLVRGAPEAKRFLSPVLCFFGRTSYAVYLTHLPVLGLMHGLLLGTRPDLASLAQIGVTIAALPVAVFVGWGLTILVEEPITAYGRKRSWGALGPAAGNDTKSSRV